jgi:hypothetical protein
MNQPIGQKRWAIAEGYIPAYGHGPEPQFTSHETACLLNTSELSLSDFTLDSNSGELLDIGLKKLTFTERFHENPY